MTSSQSNTLVPIDPLPQTRHLETEIPGPRSKALQANRQQQVPDGFGVALPIFVEQMNGAIIQDVDGNRIIDFASGIGVTSVGANNLRVRARVANQLDRFTHTCFMVTEYNSFTQVAQWLNRNTPGDFDKRTALFTTGAEAVENAIKIARSATRRDKILVFDEGYHGRSLLTMAMTAKFNPYKLNFGSFPTEVVRAPSANPLRSQVADLGVEAVTAAALKGVEDVLAEHGPTEFSAMVIEPIQGEGGFVVPSVGFLPGLREIADRHGIILIMDEIQSGMGRTGSMFATDNEGVAGDITITAKALAAGIPLSAVTGRTEIMNAVHSGGLGGTYAGNPLACEAALAVFELLEDGSILANARLVEETARKALTPLLVNSNILADIRGRGAMLAIEFADPSTLSPLADVARDVSAKCHSAGLLTLTCGTYGNVIRLLPPLVIEHGLLEDGLTILRESILRAEAETR